MTDHERPLPRRGDVARLAQHGAVLEGRLAVSDLPRLATELSDCTTVLFPVLRFAIDDEGRRTVNCRLHAPLVVVCQRCLEPMTVDATIDVNMAFVATDEQARLLPAHLEPVMLAEGSSVVDLHEMLEEELLLSLPISAFHDHCEPSGLKRHDGEPVANEVGASKKPFAALATLLGEKSGKN